MAVTDRIDRALIRCLPPEASTLVLAVSAGADSMALWDACMRLARWRLVVWHLDHGLRTDAAEDGDLIRRFAEERAAEGIEPGRLVIERADAAAAAAEGSGNIEEAGRSLRYRRLGELALDTGAAAVVTAHHRDDQAETVLLQLRRGCGPDGPLGMPRKRPLLPGIPLLRPLLALSRGDLRAVLASRGIPWREDATNADQARTRNRIRLVLLPALEAMAPGAGRALVRLARRRRRRSRDRRACAAQVFRESLRGDRLVLAAPVGAAADTRGRLWRLLLGHLRAPVSRTTVARIEDLVAGRPGRRLRLGPWLLARRADDLVWWTAVQPLAQRPIDIPGPGEYEGMAACLRIVEAPAASAGDLDRGQVLVDADRLVGGVVWRPLADGERWRPLGAPGRPGGRKTLAARGVPAGLRASLAVLADAEGVVWAPGAGIADRVRVDPGCRRAWCCELLVRGEGVPGLRDPGPGPAGT